MTNLSTPSLGGLPPMTLQQAIDLVARWRTIQHGAVGFLQAGATHESLLDHAATGIKAAIMLFERCIEVESLLKTAWEERDEVMQLLVSVHADIVRAQDHPETGELFKSLLTPGAAPEAH